MLQATPHRTLAKNRTGCLGGLSNVAFARITQASHVLAASSRLESRDICEALKAAVMVDVRRPVCIQYRPCLEFGLPWRAPLGQGRTRAAS